jgi:hypothetical protein
MIQLSSIEYQKLLQKYSYKKKKSTFGGYLLYNQVLRR